MNYGVKAGESGKYLLADVPCNMWSEVQIAQRFQLRLIGIQHYR